MMTTSSGGCERTAIASLVWTYSSIVFYMGGETLLASCFLYTLPVPGSYPPLTLTQILRRQDELWRASALRKLPSLMEATDMLVCGEDLGFVPACVHPVMQVGEVGVCLRRYAAP